MTRIHLALLAMAALAGPACMTPTAAAPSASKPEQARAADGTDEEECDDDYVTGTHIASSVCRSERQREADRRGSAEYLEDLRRRAAVGAARRGK